MDDREAYETPDIPKSTSDKLCKIVLDTVLTFIVGSKLQVLGGKVRDLIYKAHSLFVTSSIERNHCNLFTG